MQVPGKNKQTLQNPFELYTFATTTDGLFIIYTQLMSFGIPIDVLPVSDDAERKVKNHLKWIRRQSIKEQANAMGKIFNGLELPGE